MSKEIQEIIERCACVITALRPGFLRPITFVDNQGNESVLRPNIDLKMFEIEVAALGIMGLVERNKNVTSLVVDYPYAVDPVAFLRAHYEALRDEDNQNYEMLCDGMDPYVEPVSAPSDAKWYADRVDSFEQFVGLCFETAVKRADSDEKSEPTYKVLPDPIPRNIFALCVHAYEYITGPCMEIYEPDNIAHRTLIASGIVSFFQGDQLSGSRYSGYQDGETQFNEHRKACKWAMEPYSTVNRFALSVAKDVRTTREFIRKCAEFAAKEMAEEKQEEFDKQLDEIGCP